MLYWGSKGNTRSVNRSESRIDGPMDEAVSVRFSVMITEFDVGKYVEFRMEGPRLRRSNENTRFWRLKMRKTLIVLLALAVGAGAFAGGPGRGEITVRPGDAISRLSVRYNISQMMGEPTVNGTYMWESGSVTDLGYDTVVWLTVSNSMGKAYIKIDPVVPGPGEWGYNVTGSPDWDEALVSSWSGNSARAYVDADTAKAFWDRGFSVTGAELSKRF